MICYCNQESGTTDATNNSAAWFDEQMSESCECFVIEYGHVVQEGSDGTGVNVVSGSLTDLSHSKPQRRKKQVKRYHQRRDLAALYLSTARLKYLLHTIYLSQCANTTVLSSQPEEFRLT